MGSAERRTYALVTGASSGLGCELARQLAAQRHDVLLVARRRDRLERLAQEIRRDHGVLAEMMACDLASAEGRRQLVDDIDALGAHVDPLVLCAGFGIGGSFVAQDAERLEAMIRTNVEATIMLAHVFARRMAARRTGRILIISSILGNQPMPNVAVYAATKAAITSFAEALNEELRTCGVTVCVVLPGSIETEFADVAGLGRAQRRMPGALVSTPNAVAAKSLQALERGARTTIPGGPAVRALHWMGGHAPRALWLPAARRLMA
ncbi:SDR family NAD(P)-dependent oxidoreductase [Mycobacterium sp. pUA109]|uniref:SDR family NAD(P)-dependent oxidoreductase n=1 Tax=Mycobacterium sp. pUA109 TaxID=3238982 RepID=UPI00351B911D